MVDHKEKIERIANEILDILANNNCTISDFREISILLHYKVEEMASIAKIQ